MARYLVKMTPLEPYSFGTDQGFSYQDEQKLGKISYFAKSGTVPAQTTVLGLLRYLILSNTGLLKPDFRDYSDEDIRNNADAVGKKSFEFGSAEEQDFGKIKNISPLFLMRGNEIFIKNPFNNTVMRGYKPMKLGSKVFQTSEGDIFLPDKDEYNPKNGHGYGYIGVDSKEIVVDLFTSVVLTGNKKNDRNSDGSESFFKREYISLKEGFSFAVYAEAEDLPKSAIGYMGSRQSAFIIETEETENVLEDQVAKAFENGDPVCYYALSDLYVDQKLAFDSFCIAEEKYQRNLQTVYDPLKPSRKYKKSDIRINLIESGSVFYNDVTEMFCAKNEKKIGYNSIVRLGGK